MKLKIITSSDGSHTLFREDIDETYHSTHGAIQEAKHVFIKNGLHKLLPEKDSISILEVGFGTGLNAFITYLESLNFKNKISYTGIELFPVTQDIVCKLNYTEALTDKEEEKEVFSRMHQVEWGRETSFSDNFTLNKVNERIEDFSSDNLFDLVYYDAFGPRAQEEMWNKSVFAHIYNMMSSNAVFVTYCAKGQVRRDLIEVGFSVERLPGPPGKREMLRATKLE